MPVLQPTHSGPTLYSGIYRLCLSQGPQSFGASVPCDLGCGSTRVISWWMIAESLWRSLIVGVGESEGGHMAQGRKQRLRNLWKSFVRSFIHSFNVSFLRADSVSGLLLGSRPMLSNRNLTWATPIILNFLVATLKRLKKKQVKLILMMFANPVFPGLLYQHITNIYSTNDIFCVLVFILRLWNPVCRSGTS